MMKISEFVGRICGWRYDCIKAFRISVESVYQEDGTTIDIPFNVNNNGDGHIEEWGDKKVKITVELLEDDERPSV